MKFEVRILAACAALALTGAAHAQAISLNAGGTSSSGIYTASNLTGSGTLIFSQTLVAATNASGADLEPDSPATLTTVLTPKSAYVSAKASAPVTTLDGTISGTTLAVTQVATQGGVTVTTFNDGFTNTGGSLSIDDLTVDLTNSTVYATLTGANGVGTTTIALWNIGLVTGPTSFTLPSPGTTTTLTSSDVLSNLTFTTVGFNDFVKALGLTGTGVNALQTVTNVGTIDSTISATVTASISAVPEPTSLGLLLAGLGCVGVTRLRRRAGRGGQ